MFKGITLGLVLLEALDLVFVGLMDDLGSLALAQLFIELLGHFFFFVSVLAIFNAQLFREELSFINGFLLFELADLNLGSHVLKLVFLSHLVSFTLVAELAKLLIEFIHYLLVFSFVDLDFIL